MYVRVCSWYIRYHHIVFQEAVSISSCIKRPSSDIHMGTRQFIHVEEYIMSVSNPSWIVQNIKQTIAYYKQIELE